MARYNIDNKTIDLKVQNKLTFGVRLTDVHLGASMFDAQVRQEFPEGVRDNIKACFFIWISDFSFMNQLGLTISYHTLHSNHILSHSTF